MKPEQIIVNALAKTTIPVKAWSWVISQAAHETATNKGPFTSNVFIANNNAFGMKYPRKRKTTAISPGTSAPKSEGPTPYAKYNSIADSVTDLELWLRYNRVEWPNINNEVDYATFLFRKGYFGVTLEAYLKGIQYWLKKIKVPKPLIIGPIVIIGAIAIYYLLK